MRNVGPKNEICLCHDCVLNVQAIVFYELAFHFNPHCAEACNNLGVLYKDRDNLDKAVECYQVLFLHISAALHENSIVFGGL